MKATSKIALAMVGSFALGAAAVQGLHAQATPPGYAIVEVTVTDKEGYTREFLPLISKEIQAAGGKYVVRGGNPVTLQGAPPASRVAVLQFDSGMSRLGMMPEGGRARPTPWVHSDVLALIARDGLGLSPREVESS